MIKKIKKATDEHLCIPGHGQWPFCLFACPESLLFDFEFLLDHSNLSFKFFHQRHSVLLGKFLRKLGPHCGFFV